MKIKLIVDDRELIANLVANKASQDFAALLPLTLTLRDFNGTEKISDLPTKLSIEDSPPSMTPVKGDLTYYAPWGNMALFYKDFRQSDGLVLLGKLEAGIEFFQGGDPVNVRIEVI